MPSPMPRALAPTRPCGGWTRRPAIALVMAAVGLALGASACAGPTEAAGPTPSMSRGTAAPPLTTSSAAPTGAATSSPTALPGAPWLTRPILAVKIDNTSAARPRIGLTAADVVYVEPVEGGLTRLLALFSSTLPTQVGPVRSARESDVALLGNYGRVAFAFSGGSPYTLQTLAKGTQVDVSYDSSMRGFRREPSRRAPYNVIGDPAALMARSGVSTPPTDAGWRIGPPPAGAQPATRLDAAYPACRLSFAWDAARGEYLVTTDGRPELDENGRQLGAASVVVLTVPVHLSGNIDVAGSPTPVVTLVGTGAARVLRDGQASTGTWARADVGSPTLLSTVAGAPMTIPRGPVWVLLVGAGQTVSVTATGPA